MIILTSRVVIILSRIYVVAALIAAAVLSTLALSFVPILLLAWYLYVWRWPINTLINLLTEYFMFFTITLLFTASVGPYSVIISLPLLLLTSHGLEKVAEFLVIQETKYVRRPTKICITLILIVILVLVISLLMGSLSLLLACITMIVYLGILGNIVVRQLPLKPVAETKVQQRMVVGTTNHIDIGLTSKTRIGGLMFLESPYEWLKVSPGILSLKLDEMTMKLSLSPILAGPSTVKVNGKATDRWGLFQIGFELEPVHLYAIPRARYAAWLANRYLAGTSVGSLPLISNMEAAKQTYGLRRGVEYYGSQLYQPGDSLKNIDWKHSLKYNELISKEYTEFQGQSAVILINLAVSNAEEADKLAYNIIVTAVSLAQENIPAALAVYNHEDVKLTTVTLQPRQLLVQCLQVAQDIITFINPYKYLNPPDVTRLRGNISRLRFTDSESSKALSQLLQLEYLNLDNAARLNPATRALSEVFSKVDKQSNIVILSQRNHDAEALEFNSFSFTRKGNSIITV